MPIPSLSNPKTLADQSRLKLFPLQSGPQFANVNISTGASGIVFTGYTRDASADNDAFSCCGSYTLRNSVHAAIAGMTSDNCTLFALKSVINQRPCLAVGGFDAEGKPVQLSQTEFEQVTRPLFNFADKVSPILGSEPAPGIQVRSGDASYNYQVDARSGRFRFTYKDSMNGGLLGPSADGNVSLEHDGHRLARISAGGSYSQSDNSISGSAYRDIDTRGFEATVRSGQASAMFGRTYTENAITRKIGLGYGDTSLRREDTPGGTIKESLEHKLEKITLEVSRTRDRAKGTEYMLTIKMQL
ncbi:hypothetical protein [Agrobacterium tumefaciens]|uniref:hypothetical protein n=1 Tax=Agrobacterium tumefaciens TaxID=358 RepID=UPI000FA47B65|nr:hypothetical protein [Agrobacterium tumefaciens]NSX92110.1 hypothetical protein [Agrobacterium tumefaciens]